MTRILLVDDHPIVLNGLKTLLEEEPELQVVAAVQSGESALQFLEFLTIDLLITDLEMPGMKGEELIKIVKEKTRCKVLVLSMYDERSKFQTVMELGIDGYVLKDADKEDFLFAVRSIIQGKSYFSPSFAEKAFLKESVTTKSNVQLTAREIDVLKLLAEGLSNREVGEKLFLSPRTVDTHRTNLMRKLEVRNIVELVRYALREGLVK